MQEEMGSVGPACLISARSPRTSAGSPCIRGPCARRRPEARARRLFAPAECQRLSPGCPSRYSPRSPALQSETVHYKRGVSQQFSLPSFKIDFSEWKDDEVTFFQEPLSRIPFHLWPVCLDEHWGWLGGAWTGERGLGPVVAAVTGSCTRPWGPGGAMRLQWGRIPSSLWFRRWGW